MIRRLGVMQPYFFPYLGYFDLINQVDFWVGFDVVKYQPKSWMNRNRILHPSRGWQYITVPVNRRGGPWRIADIRVQDIEAARARLLGQLEHYRGRAPHFAAVQELVARSFAAAPDDRLLSLNMAALETVCAHIGIDFKHETLTAMGLELGQIEHAGQWALEIARVLGAVEYVNPPGGRDIFRVDEWRRHGIRLRFTDVTDLQYDSSPYQFEPGLSVLDVLMWSEPAAIKAYLDHRKGHLVEY